MPAFQNAPFAVTQHAVEVIRRFVVGDRTDATLASFASRDLGCLAEQVFSARMNFQPILQHLS